VREKIGGSVYLSVLSLHLIPWGMYALLEFTSKTSLVNDF